MSKELARQIDRKKVEPCKPEVANGTPAIWSVGPAPFNQKENADLYRKKAFSICRRSTSTVVVISGRRSSSRSVGGVLEPKIVEVTAK